MTYSACDLKGGQPTTCSQSGKEMEKGPLVYGKTPLEAPCFEVEQHASCKGASTLLWTVIRLIPRTRDGAKPQGFRYTFVVWMTQGYNRTCAPGGCGSIKMRSVNRSRMIILKPIRQLIASQRELDRQHIRTKKNSLVRSQYPTIRT